MESSYIYDALGQLTEFTRGDYSESYTYDPAGNMLEKTAGGIKTQYTYNAANQLVGDGTYEYTYDRIGNLVEKAGNGGLVSYTYNALNLLEQWTDGESNESYTYNAAGLLSTVKTNTSTTTLTWDILTGDGVVVSAENNGTVTDYTYGLERISANTGRARTEYVYDARGSVIGEVTKAGLLSKTAVTAKAYTPFGEQIGESTSGFGWNGEYYNAVTGQVYLRARFYEPEMNRFSQKDVLRGNVFSGTSLNRYLYCSDDPVNFTDPSGMRQVENVNPQKDSVSRVVKTNNSANAKAEQIRQQALRDEARRQAQERKLADKEPPDTDTAGVENGQPYACDHYDREAAIEYARRYSSLMQGIPPWVEFLLGAIGIGRNTSYANLPSNCTNFVSQVLYAGGISMNDEWYSYELYTGSDSIILYSPSWVNANSSYIYFSTPENGYMNGDEPIVINNDSELSVSEQITRAIGDGVQPGDLIYFRNTDGEISHAAIVSVIDDGEIYYSGNSKRRFDTVSLADGMNPDSYTSVEIVEIKNELYQ